MKANRDNYPFHSQPRAIAAHPSSFATRSRARKRAKRIDAIINASAYIGVWVIVGCVVVACAMLQVNA